MIPTLPGVPSWGAVLIAITFSAIGFAFDAGSGGKELTFAFAAAYALGCVLAVVAVRQTGVFTAVIQPPLVLFVTVPGAYFLFHSGAMDGLKDLLINCGYPLIERFPLMFFTSAIVLLVGLFRWYTGMSRRRTAVADVDEEGEAEGRFSAVTAKISALLTRDGDEDDAPAPRRSKQHSIDRSAKTGKATARTGRETARTSRTSARASRTGAKGDDTDRAEARAERTSTRGDKASAAGTSRTRSGRPTKRTQPSRSRHTRPPETEIIEAVTDRPRRPRTDRRTTDQKTPPPEARRRNRSSSTREPRKQPPASERRSPYKRPDRHTRFDGFEPFEPHGSNGSNGNGSGNGSHHPVSRVRYRGADEGDQRPQYRSLPRPAKHRAEAWEYDV
jgi:hypothetical protein